MYKIKNLYRLFLKRFWYEFRRLYEKDTQVIREKYEGYTRKMIIITRYLFFADGPGGNQ